jgi:trimethylamine:corrinoid methyltransferase-like protein
MLDDQKIEQIHEASLRILQELGIMVEDADLRQELCDLGYEAAQVDWGTAIVYIAG